MREFKYRRNFGWGNRAARIPVLLLLPFLLLLVQAQALGQRTNLEVYQQLAVECIGAVPDTMDSFTLAASENLPYLRPALTARWQEEQKQVFLGEANSEPGRLPRLTYEISDAKVEYVRIDRRSWGRRVSIDLHYSLTDRNGRLLADERCTRTYEGTFAAGTHEALELPLYAETQAEPPQGRAIQRYVEPVVIGAAITVMAYLFFTVRSRSDTQ